MATSGLGDFLRGRRATISPAEVGLVAGDGRRVSGLRREEVALLAGMSVDYYIRLEQGRERHPSAQVLDALVEAFRLDDDARLHLFRLAGAAPPLRATGTAEQVDPSLRQLLDGWSDHPALVLGRHYDVLAANRIGRALFAPFSHSDNLLLNIFLDPVASSFYVHHHAAAVNTVAGFRLVTSAAPHDPRTVALVEQLHAASPQFREIWRRNDARGKTAEVKTFHHPDVGELVLRMQTFDVRAAPGQQLVVYHAEPGSPSAQAVALLGTLAATADTDQS